MLIVNRREFCALAAAASLSVLDRTRRPRPSPVRIGVLVPATSTDRRVRAALDGITLGAEEAARTAALFGTDLEVLERYTFGPADPAADAQSLLDEGVHVLVSTFGSATAASLDAFASTRQRALLHVVAPPPDGQVGTRAPSSWGLYVPPSAEARAEAVMTALHEYIEGGDGRPTVDLVGPQEAYDAARAIDTRVAARLRRTALLDRFPAPPSLASASGGGILAIAAHDAESMDSLLPPPESEDPVVDVFGVTELLERKRLPRGLMRADAWLPSLERFGAGQLNDRFRARFLGNTGQSAMVGMTGPAWAGWFAMKAAVETSLRARTGAAGSLRRAILAARFDGHKGTPLAFTPGGVLTHPLYVTGIDS